MQFPNNLGKAGKLCANLWVITFMMLSGLMLSGCGGGGGTTSPAAPAVTLSGIAITPTSATIAPGLTASFIATGTYSDSSKANITSTVTWKSSNNAAATINAAGVAAGVAAGTTSITASFTTAAGILTSPATTLTVVGLTGITIAPVSATVAIGQTTGFTATGTYGTSPADITNSVNWSSSATASITTGLTSGNGVATGIASGSVTITAAYSGFSATAALTVVPAPPIGVFAVSATVSGVNQVTVSWSPPPAGTAPTSYNIYWGTAPGITTASTRIAGVPSGYVHTGLTANTPYYYRVSAVVGGVESLLSAETYAYVYSGGAPAGTFTATTGMTTARQLHTATPLANGKVLIAGGQDNSSTILSSAEIYSAASGVFATTGPMTTAREQHTATRLPSGDVLITGGKGASILASAEIYSAASGVFATTGSMVTARYFHSAVLLPNGKVLVAGGIGTGGNLASAELYDPATKTFSPTGSMITARYEFTATLLPSGKVLIAGGTGNAGVLNSAELYDPAGNAGVGRFATTGNMAVPRSGPTATLLPNGKVLIYGGSGGIVGSTAYYPPSAELYDGTTSFSTAGSTVMARYGHSATMLSNGLVLVAGGQNSATTYTNTADLYDPTANTFAPTGSMSVSRYFHTAAPLPNGQVLISGGSDGNSTLGTEDLFH